MIKISNFHQRFPRDTERFIRFVQQRLHQQGVEPFSFNFNGDFRRISAVLFLLGMDSVGHLSLILNKRSSLVRQPGDLCCPGGGITPGVDFLIARCLDLPFSPLHSWLYRKRCKRNCRFDNKKLKLLLATALREGVEEMRLNPFGINFLGRLPEQQLLMFQRSIFPLVGWVRKQQRFFPNWEVDRIVRIPVLSFFEKTNYARFRLKSDRNEEELADALLRSS
jgi:hypothetical protein